MPYGRRLSRILCRSEDSYPRKPAQGRTLIDRLFAESHFLLLPSRADCAPVVIAEAGSFGVPVVASDVGGISTAVRNGINGYVLHAGQLVTDACNVIFKSMESPNAYRELACRSFGEYTRTTQLANSRASGA